MGQFDPLHSQYWVKEMEDIGFEMEKTRQGVYTLSEPMKQLESDIRNYALNYDSNPIVKRCLANTQAKVEVNGNIQPSKPELKAQKDRRNHDYDHCLSDAQQVQAGPRIDDKIA